MALKQMIIIFVNADPAAMAWLGVQADLQGAAGLHRHVPHHQPHLQAGQPCH